MKKILFICPYFGKYPNYFNLTLKSIENNPTIDWLIITDITTKYNYPSNVTIVYMKFNELQKKFQSYFDFPITLDKPYKLCDYKCTYGLIFKEFITNYDFWGHCDFDCIFGDLRKYLPDNLLNTYERIFCRGHLSIYKNQYKINTLFKNIINEKKCNYREVFSSSEPFSFDEFGIIKISMANNIKIYDKFVFADIYPWIYPFKCAETSVQYNQKQIFKYEQGKLYSIFLDNNTILSKEYMYIHLQRRFMINSVINPNKFLIIPNKFIEFTPITKKFIKKNSKNKILYKQFIRLKHSYTKRKHSLNTFLKKWE